ncbi:hypothetical protein Taro_032182 [Colocasia esculenta]|uniref:Uncharacterized protein n=1 Tax=Colocasia esculenta TaxID=4460 RepID=A0A843VS06_COLES|nr:hypothetical protein [Colocasia esculenta]
MKNFREAIGGFAEPSTVAGREHVEGSNASSSNGCERNWSTFTLIHTEVRNRLSYSYRRLDNLVYMQYNMRLRVKHLIKDPKQRVKIDYYPVNIRFLRDDEDSMVAWVARATTEREDYELDEEADDPTDPPRPNTFLARAIAEATVEEERDRGDADPEAEVDLLRDIELERVKSTIGEGHGHDDDEFERLMQDLPRTRSLREAPSQSRRTGSSAHVAAPSQSRRPPISSQLVVLLQMVEVAVVTHLREVLVTVVREVEVEVVTVFKEVGVVG